MKLPYMRFVLMLALMLGSRSPIIASDISPAGEQLAKTLDSLNVEQLWLAGRQVDWRTGLPNGKVYTNTTSHTHCSAFAAAAADKLGVYLLRPPEHSTVLLANAQQEWLSHNGTNEGWHPVSSPIAAQKLANDGQLVVVTYKSHDAKRPGHIAVIRPSRRDDAEIISTGPEIIQAGVNNYNSTNASEGFKHHAGAFKKNELLYFYHAVGIQKPAQNQPVNISATKSKIGAQN